MLIFKESILFSFWRVLQHNAFGFFFFFTKLRLVNSKMWKKEKKEISNLKTEKTIEKDKYKNQENDAKLERKGKAERENRKKIY